MEHHLTVSGTGIAQSALDTVLAAWGVPGIVAVLAVGAFIWWTRATSGLNTERETTIKRLQDRLETVTQQRDKATDERDKWRESYYAVKFPASNHEDVAGKSGIGEETA